MKRLYIALLLVFTSFISGAVLTASEINIAWDNYFTEIEPGVYETIETKYVSKISTEYDLYLNFFDNITKLEIGIKDLFPPFGSTYFLSATSEAKQVDFSNARYHEFTGLTFNKSKYSFSYREAGLLSNDILNYKFQVNESTPLELAVYMPSGTSSEYPISVYRFRVTGTPKERSTQTVDAIAKPEMINGGAVWHSEVIVSGVERAYVHMQIFDQTAGSWVRTSSDNTIKTGINPTFDINLSNSFRFIKAPHGYSDLMIDNNGQINSYPNVKSIKFEVNYAYDNVNEIVIYDADFGVKLGSITDKTKVYWQKGIDTTFDVKIASWDELPKGTQSYNDIGSFEDIQDVSIASIIPKENGLYDVRVKSGNQFYLAQNISIPAKVQSYSDVYAYYFSTLEGGHIWFFFNEVDTVAKSLVNDSWLIWNLSTGEWRQVLHTTIHGLPWYDKNKTFAPAVYTDISIPYPVDDILSITVDFQLSYHYPFSISHMGSYYGEYQDKQVVLTRDNTQTLEIKWWRFASKVYYAAVKKVYGSVFDDKINEIEKLTVTDVYKENFITQLENRGSGTYTMANVFPPGSDVYRLFLGQYNKVGSDGVAVKDVTYSDFTYVYQGVEYSEPFPQQETPNPPLEYPEDEGKSPSWVFKIWLWILDHPGETITIVVIGAIALIFGPLIITLIVRWKNSLSSLKSKKRRRR
jgi:hypothetical protein